MKDYTVPRDDIYKSGTIHTGQGEPANSRSRPTPRAARIPGKPITNGKLLKPGGSGGASSKLPLRPAISRPIPEARTPVQQPVAETPRTPDALVTNARPASVRQPVHSLNGINHGRTDSTSSIKRGPPPPPPVAPPAAAKGKIYRVLYAFTGRSETELSVDKDELVEVIKKDSNGTYISSIPISSTVVYLHRTTDISARMVVCPKSRRLRRELGSGGLSQRRARSALCSRLVSPPQPPLHHGRQSQLRARRLPAYPVPSCRCTPSRRHHRQVETCAAGTAQTSDRQETRSAAAGAAR